MHSNKFSHITAIKPQAHILSPHPAYYEIINHKYSKLRIDTSTQKLTHYLNSLILHTFSNSHRIQRSVDQVEEIIIIIGKDSLIKHVITIFKMDDALLKYDDFFDLDKGRELIILMS